MLDDLVVARRGCHHAVSRVECMQRKEWQRLLAREAHDDIRVVQQRRGLQRSRADDAIGGDYADRCAVLEHGYRARLAHALCRGQRARRVIAVVGHDQHP